WKSGSDADKQAAYATLYEALVTVSKLLAPAMPFIADELYQNLVRLVDPDAPTSVHVAAWPQANAGLINDNLNREMALVMKLASLGHAARNKANRKVRQPLAEAAFSVGSAVEQNAVQNYADLLEDELNVKKVRILDTAGEAADFSINPLPKQLGQKYGSRFPAIRAAILELNAEEVAKRLLAGENISLTVGGDSYEILGEEVEVRAQARSGFAVAADGAYLAALVTSLTPELVQEGLAREFVRRVQDLRKQADLDISDRIILFYEVSAGLGKAVQMFKDYVQGETLTLELVAGRGPEGAPTSSDAFDGETLTIGLRRAQD
ncbi:MAG: DUF5915 domain-containing protein, partial [Anaerolineaceae bacterium]|nr:DUF5915 domain-containing protein [Anaerolineaceae bacterium]